jgi:hypothetical protein
VPIVSEAPSYHSTIPGAETTPPYVPPGTTAAAFDDSLEIAAAAEQEADRSRTPQPALPHTIGLPPIPPLPHASRQMPTLSEFRIPTWSTISSNPTARHYHSVAQRRVARDSDPAESLRQHILKQVIDQEEEIQNRQFRPLEDPYLVGEDAARKARDERLAKENGEDILVREDRRWDLLLSMSAHSAHPGHHVWVLILRSDQMRDWNHRERSWTRLRRDIESGERMKLAGRLRGRLML